MPARKDRRGQRYEDIFREHDDTLGLHSEDIKALMGHIQALSMRVMMLEEKLRMTERAEVPGD